MPAVFKQKAAQAASQAYESTVAATATVKQKAAERDWTKEQQVLGRAQKAALGCVCPHPAALSVCNASVRRLCATPSSVAFV